jgi:hypothetical protein
MSEMVISIADRYSKFPAGRYRADGPFNAERFRDEFLLPALDAALQKGDKVVVKLDGVIGYSSSFLEEVFGGVVRARKQAADRLKQTLQIRADDVAYSAAKLDAERYFSDALGRN